MNKRARFRRVDCLLHRLAVLFRLPVSFLSRESSDEVIQRFSEQLEPRKPISSDQKEEDSRSGKKNSRDQQIQPQPRQRRKDTSTNHIPTHLEVAERVRRRYLLWEEALFHRGLDERDGREEEDGEEETWDSVEGEEMIEGALESSRSGFARFGWFGSGLVGSENSSGG